MRWHPGGPVHSVSGDPVATQTKRLRRATASPPSPLPPRLGAGRWQSPSTSAGYGQPQHKQRGHCAGRGGGGGSERRRRLPATVPDALQPPSSPPATPTLAPRPPVASCPGSLFLSPHFASWGLEDQIPPASYPPPTNSQDTGGCCARRSRRAHRGHKAGSCTPFAALNFSPGCCTGQGAGARARRSVPFPRGFLARRVTLGSPYTWSASVYQRMRRGPPPSH